MATFNGSSSGLGDGGTVYGSLEIKEDLTVDGDISCTNLNVSDTLTADTIVTNEELEVKDVIITMNVGAVGNTNSTALLYEYNDGGSKWSGIGRDVDDGAFYVFQAASTKPGAGTDIAGLIPAALHALRVTALVSTSEIDPDTPGGTILVGPSAGTIEVGGSSTQVTFGGATQINKGPLTIVSNTGTNSAGLALYGPPPGPAQTWAVGNNAVDNTTDFALWKQGNVRRDLLVDYATGAATTRSLALDQLSAADVGLTMRYDNTQVVKFETLGSNRSVLHDSTNSIFLDYNPGGGFIVQHVGHVLNGAFQWNSGAGVGAFIMESNTTANQLRIKNSASGADICVFMNDASRQTIMHEVVIKNTTSNDSRLTFCNASTPITMWNQGPTILSLTYNSGANDLVQFDTGNQRILTEHPILAPHFTLLDSSNVFKWTMGVGASDVFELKDSTFGVRMSTTQAGVSTFTSLASSGSIDVGTGTPATQWTVPSTRATVAGQVLMDSTAGGSPSWGIATVPQIFSSGGVMNANLYGVVWSNGAAGGVAAENQNTRHIMLGAGRITRFGWSTSASAANTEYKININGVNNTFTTGVAAANGFITIGPYAVAAGDMVCIGYTGVGTAPTNAVMSILVTA